LIDEGESEEIYNEDWAKVTELPLNEINNLERSFLRQMVCIIILSLDINELIYIYL
jgi:hypothetical protein